MKKLIYVLVALATILTVSCNKTSINEPEHTPQLTQNKGGGLLPDGPEFNRTIKYQYSEEFMRKGRTMSFVKGKRVLDLGVEEANNEFQTAARGPKKNGNGGGTIGGNTGGSTTTTTDWNAPRVLIVSPTAGQVYDLASLMYNGMDCTFGFDDDIKLVRYKITIRGDVIKDTSGILDAPSGQTWTMVQFIYRFPYGDGIYDVNAQAWDVYGNTTTSTVIVSRNTQMTPLPTNFPSSYILPSIATDAFINQGGEGSCASFTVANAYAIDRYVAEGQTSGFNGNNVYSPEWLYNLCIAQWRINNPTFGCGTGSSISQNMNIIQSRGIPTWNALPYSSLNGCDTTMFTDAIRANAALNKKGYGGTAVSADRNLIKLKIYQGKPLMTTFQIDTDYINAGPNYIWTFPHDLNGGPHAMIVIGFDDSKNAYLCLNSWGTGWGTTGKIWVDYDFYEAYCSSGHFFN